MTRWFCRSVDGRPSMIWDWETSIFLPFLFFFIYAGQKVEGEFSMMPELLFSSFLHRVVSSYRDVVQKMDLDCFPIVSVDLKRSFCWIQI